MKLWVENQCLGPSGGETTNYPSKITSDSLAMFWSVIIIFAFLKTLNDQDKRIFAELHMYTSVDWLVPCMQNRAFKIVWNREHALIVNIFNGHGWLVLFSILDLGIMI